MLHFCRPRRNNFSNAWSLSKPSFCISKYLFLYLSFPLLKQIFLSVEPLIQNTSETSQEWLPFPGLLLQRLEPESLPHVFFCKVFPFYDTRSNWSCLLIFPHSCSFPTGALSQIFCGLMHEAPCVSARVGFLMPATEPRRQRIFHTESLWV